MTKTLIWSAVLVAGGIAVGVGINRMWRIGVMPVVSAQQGRRNALPTMESLPAEVGRLAGRISGR